MSGRVVGQTAVEVRTVTVEASAAGDFVLEVDEAADFDAPGWCRVDAAAGSQVFEVGEVDTDGDVLVLRTALPWAVEVDAPVVACNAAGGAIISSVEATFDTGDDGQDFADLPPEAAAVDLVGGQMAFVGGTPVVRRLPEVAPAVSPDIEVTPLPTGLLVTADFVPAGTQVTYELSTDSGFATIEQTLTTSNRPVLLTGLTADMDYYLRVTATNSVRTDEPRTFGPFRTRKLEDGEIASIAADKIAAGDFMSAYALVGSLDVGSSIKISPDTGFSATSVGGRRTVLGHPTDDPIIEAPVTTWGLTSEGNANLLGGNNYLRGSMLVAGGITAPAVAPRASVVWPTSKRVVLHSDEFHLAASRRGLWWDGSRWWSAHFNIYLNYLLRYAPDGVNDPVAMPVLPHIPVGYCNASGLHYIVGRDKTTETFRLYAYNSSWVQTAVVVLPDMDAEPAVTITSAGVEVFYCRDGNLRRRTHDLGTLNVAANVVVDSTWGAFNVRGAVMGSLDYGTSYVLAVRGSVVRAYQAVSSTTYTRQTARDFGRPNGEDISGLAWNGTSLVALTTSGNLWTYSPVTATVNRSLRNTKFGGTVAGLPETTPSPARTYSQAARTWMLLQADPVQGSGQPTDPDRPRFYIDGHLQTPDVAAGVLTLTVGAPVVSGIPVPTTNGFAAIGGLNGSLKSEAVMTTGQPVWAFNGDGPSTHAGVTYNAAGLAIAGSYRKYHLITPTAANTPTTLRINFGFTFAAVPNISLTRGTSDPRVTNASWSSVTTTYVDVVVVRTNSADPVGVNVTAELPSA